MSRLGEELKAIPPLAWAIAALSGVGIVTFMLTVFEGPPERGFGVFMLIMAAVAVSFSLYVLLVGYIFGDARRRGMRAVLWALLAFFIPNAIGIILYFILREPLLRECPRCGAKVSARFPFCSSCGASLGAACPSCHSTVEPGWSHCARCGARTASERS